MTPMSQQALQPYFQQLDLCMIKDRQGFFRRLRKLQKNNQKQDFDETLKKLAGDLDKSVAQAKLRLEQSPAPNFPEGFRAGYEIRGFKVGHARFPTGPEEAKQIAELHNRVACLLAEFGFAEAAEVCAACNDTSENATGIGRISRADIERIVEEAVAKFRQHP